MDGPKFSGQRGKALNHCTGVPLFDSEFRLACGAGSGSSGARGSYVYIACVSSF